ncbi:MAG: sodium:solute symporter family protein [Planctomycetota bacterium]|nr:MAG: sodium:solute symporter family protein [Planctomycetota bacterium]
MIAYLGGMLAVGALVARRVRNFADFFVAGHRMTTPILVCTLVSTYYGLDVTLGTSETSFLEGMAAFWTYSAPFYLAYAGVALLVAPRLKRLPVQSLPEAMGHFYGPGTRVAAACASFVYSAPVLAVTGMGLLGELLLGWEPWMGASVGAGVALAYTLMGGLWADAITDTFQFALMCVSVAVAAAAAMLEVGTHHEIGQRLGPGTLSLAGGLSPSDILIYGAVAMTPMVEPAFYQRIFAAGSARQIRNALLIGTVLWMAFDWLVVYLGLVGRDMVRSGALPADTDASVALFHVAGALLPAGMMGLFIAGILATAMSTIDSYTLIAAGNVVYDAYPSLARKPLTDRQLLFWTRTGCVLALAASVFLGLRFARLRDAWIFMSTALLSTVFVPMLAALFFLKRPSPAAGRLSAWTGLLAAFGLFLAFELLGVEDREEETLVLRSGGFALEREAALLLTVPASALAFLAGRALDLRRRRTA